MKIFKLELNKIFNKIEYKLKSKEKLIIFDLDGVLINSLPNMKFALSKTSNHIKQKISFQKYKNILDYPLKKILIKLKVRGEYNKIKSLYSKYSLQKIKKIKN